MELNIENVIQITKTVYIGENQKCKTITIVNSNGDKITINLWSKQLSNLKIKSE